MKDFELLFKQHVAEWLEAKLPVESQPIEVLYVEDDVQELGGCETCGPTYDVSVEIYYTEQAGKRRRLYTYEGSLVELIKELGSA